MQITRLAKELARMRQEERERSQNELAKLQVPHVLFLRGYVVVVVVVVVGVVPLRWRLRECVLANVTAASV